MLVSASKNAKSVKLSNNKFKRHSVLLLLLVLLGFECRLFRSNRRRLNAIILFGVDDSFVHG